MATDKTMGYIDFTFGVDFTGRREDHINEVPADMSNAMFLRFAAQTPIAQLENGASQADNLAA